MNWFYVDMDSLIESYYESTEEKENEAHDESASAAMNLNALVNCAKGALCDQHKPWTTL